MIKHLFQTSFIVAISAISVWAGAENIYKCGTSYSQTPCAGGQVLSVDDQRTPVQQQSTKKAVNNTQKMAEKLKKQRLALEKQAADDARKAAKNNTAPTPPSAGQ
jgi:hypothetical protein